jgi:hypothetical protein
LAQGLDKRFPSEAAVALLRLLTGWVTAHTVRDIAQFVVVGTDHLVPVVAAFTAIALIVLAGMAAGTDAIGVAMLDGECVIRGIRS